MTSDYAALMKSQLSEADKQASIGRRIHAIRQLVARKRQPACDDVAFLLDAYGDAQIGIIALVEQREIIVSGLDDLRKRISLAGVRT